MPRPRSPLRQLLDLLKRDELLTLSQRLWIELTQRRELAAIRLELWRRRSRLLSDLGEALSTLPKPRLSHLCDHFELDVPSRHKDGLLTTLSEYLSNPDDFEYLEDPSAAEETSEDEAEELDVDLSRDERALLRLVPRDGTSVGNGRLRRDLDWDEARYWRVRDGLVEKGFLAVGFGRGGSVYRVFDEGGEDLDEEAEPEDVADADDAPELPGGEASLYPGVQQMLEQNWQQLFPGFSPPMMHWVDSSPRQGRRPTGGRWTRPDLSAVTINKYRYVPGSHLDVFTFEVKPRGQLNVLGLYEALGHSRRANFAYVLFQVAPDEPDLKLEELKREAVRLKVGLATFEDPRVSDTWTVHVLPARHDPEARFLNEFIETLPEKIRHQIEAYIK